MKKLLALFLLMVIAFSIATAQTDTSTTTETTQPRDKLPGQDVATGILDTEFNVFGYQIQARIIIQMLLIFIVIIILIAGFIFNPLFWFLIIIIGILYLITFYL